MKFINDGTAKLRIVPETRQESQWVDSLKESARRVKPGSEPFVLRAFKAWCSGTVPAAQAKAQAEAKAKKAEERKEAIAKALAEVSSWAFRLAHDLDVGREEVGSLVSEAFHLAQLAGVNGPELSGISWTEKPSVISLWLDTEF